MNKELATKICTYIESSVTEKDIIKNNFLAVQIESLKNYLLGSNFSSAAAKTHIDKLVSQCPKFLRRDLYSSFVPKHEQDSAISKRKARQNATEYVETNIASPWQGGAPGSGKRA